LIQKLYKIEKPLRGATAQDRFERRQQHAKPIINKLHVWLIQTLPQVPPKTALGKALHYLHNEWDKLIRYLDDGRLEIDNNLAENTIRPFVVGRKNWLFSQSVAGVKARSTCTRSSKPRKPMDWSPMPICGICLSSYQRHKLSRSLKNWYQEI
jgi:transposase